MNGRSRNNGLPKSRSSTEFDLTFKVMLIGDSGVGKTCLLVRYKDGGFLGGNFISTVGVDFKNKIVTVEDKRIKLQIWDTAGQERFRSMTHGFFRDAHALILVYDICNAASFSNVMGWMSDIRRHAAPKVTLMLVGNKSDCSAKREVLYRDGERLAQENNIAFLETSAKTGSNVDVAFMGVAKELFQKSLTAADYIGTHRDPNNKFNLKDYIETEKEPAGCCGRR
uniref:Ras-related protein Rab-26-like n=1 Tax=Phallusia mammillata TaxID=59560 RepID=A0A6F9DQU5_9ASCI|nr:ras-related protein Rab-26-like [Phallusia mammillata]